MNIQEKMRSNLNKGVYMSFRKKDYIIFYVLIVTILVMNLIAPVKLGNIFAIIIGAFFPTLILGTITNLLFKKR